MFSGKQSKLFVSLTDVCLRELWPHTAKLKKNTRSFDMFLLFKSDSIRIYHIFSCTISLKVFLSSFFVAAAVDAVFFIFIILVWKVSITAHETGSK